MLHAALNDEVDTPMTAFRLQSSSVRAAAVFKTPILSWSGDVSARFFQALYGALGEMLYVQPNDLVASGGMSLGDCSAALRVFGTNNMLTLRANTLMADFPNISPDRIEFIDSVILQGYQAFRSEFSEIEIASIEANAGRHYEIIDGSSAGDVIQAASNLRLQGHFADVVAQPALRFKLVSKQGEWSSRATIEHSEVVENGLFFLRETNINDLSSYETVEQQFQLVERIDQMIIEMAGLKPTA